MDMYPGITLRPNGKVRLDLTFKLQLFAFKRNIRVQPEQV
jgi:hypothetical protein